uniref:Kelch-like protein diablo n=1 Tax=Glossina palpalis gambiensis TaxID=67801 RepID=A0A1B0BL20_9MUSC
MLTASILNIFIFVVLLCVYLSNSMAAKIVNQVESIYAKKCKNLDYGKTYLDGLTKMRINQKLFDFSLDVNGELIYVHKLALVIASDYFAAMFEADMKERKEGTVKLQDVDVVAVKALVDYIYSGIITLTEANVEAVLSASDLFQIVWVKEECIKFLKNNLNRNNCFRVRKFAGTSMHSCEDLQDASHKYILNHFDDLIAEEDLLLLSFEEIKELIKDVQHVVKPEDIAYKAAINWIKHDLERRRVHLAELMSQIRLPLVSTKFLTGHIVVEPLLREDHKCSQFVIEALIFQLASVTDLDERYQAESKYRNESFHVFLVGGTTDYDRGQKECKVYDISKKKLFSISSMNGGRCDNSAVSLNGVVYSVGGCGGINELSTAECYDPAKNRWKHIAPMNNSRSEFGICTYDGLVYVVGGNENSTVESYNPATNKWIVCQNIPLENREEFLSLATVAENSIYSLTQVQAGNALFRFDPRDGKWCSLNEMSATYSLYELVSYDRTLFAVGRDDCRRLDIRVNKWKPMPHMLSNRGYFPAVIAEKDIYVLGGTKRGSSQLIKSVERFNISNNEWTTVGSIKIECSDGGAAVLSGEFDFN